MLLQTVAFLLWKFLSQNFKSASKALAQNTLGKYIMDAKHVALVDSFKWQTHGLDFTGGCSAVVSLLSTPHNYLKNFRLIFYRFVFKSVLSGAGFSTGDQSNGPTDTNTRSVLKVLHESLLGVTTDSTWEAPKVTCEMLMKSIEFCFVGKNAKTV